MVSLRLCGPLLVAAALLGACGSESEPGSELIVKREDGGQGGASAGKGGSGGSAQAGQGGSSQAGSAGSGGSSPAGAGGAAGSQAGGSSQAGSSQAGSSQAGSSQAGSSQAGSSQAGSSQAGSSQAGSSQAGSSQAGGAGEGGSAQAGSGGAGQAGASGQAGSGGEAPSVAINKPTDGAKLENPVAFSLEAHGVAQVELVADDQLSLPLTWSPQSSSTNSFSYTFTSLGQHSLKLSGYLEGQSTPAAEDSVNIEVIDPLSALCQGVSTAKFQPPTTCDKLSGNTTSQIPANGIFSTSWFGCYKKSDGSIYKDPGDNCEFACGNKGLCSSGLDGPSCEAQLKWFAADADRFGCGGRIRVTNCANSKQVVLTTLDKGPNCKSVEQEYGAPVLDMSHDAMIYLFDGKTYGGSDLKRVVIEKVDASTKLGPAE